MSERFAGKVAVVSGAASGIGRATARLFAAEGAALAITDRDLDGLAQTKRDIAADGAEVLSIPGDIRDWGTIDSVIEDAAARFERIDVLFNCAGGTSAYPTHELPEARYRSFVALNLDAVFRGCQQVVPIMMRQGGGAIVNVSSVMGVNGTSGAIAYGAAKAGVINLTRCIAVEYAEHGIRANVIIPGSIASEGNLRAQRGLTEEQRRQSLRAIPMGRQGEPDEAARLVAFLASDDASYITGAAITIDGGMSAQLRTSG